MFTKAFWKDAFERAAKTLGQVEAALWTANGLDVLHADGWAAAGTVGAAAVLVSLATSLASLNLGAPGTASATKAVQPAPGN